MEQIKNESGTLQEQLLQKTVVTEQPKKNTVKKEIVSGRRKTAVARVKLVAGTGVILINKKPLNEYFKLAELRSIVNKPLVLFGKESQFDIFANVNGGGTRGQAEAIRLAVAKLYCANNEEARKELRANGWLTRDSRMVERKKYGLHKARRAPQFSKR